MAAKLLGRIFSASLLLIMLAAAVSPATAGLGLATENELADRGDPNPQLDLGLLYELGHGVAVDPSTAAAW